jgi:hypothetical protein
VHRSFRVFVLALKYPLLSHHVLEVKTWYQKKIKLASLSFELSLLGSFLFSIRFPQGPGKAHSTVEKIQDAIDTSNDIVML